MLPSSSLCSSCALRVHNMAEVSWHWKVWCTDAVQHQWTRCRNTGTKLLLNKQCKQLSLSQALTLGWPLVVSLALLLGAEAQIEVLLDPLPASSKASGSPSTSARSEHQGFRNPITCTCNFAALRAVSVTIYCIRSNFSADHDGQVSAANCSI